MRKANLGKKHTAEARANISKAQKKRGVIPPAAGRPWTAEEDALLEDCTIAEVVEKTGRTKVAVYSRRKTLNMTGNPPAGVPWTPEEDALVREFSVGEVMLKTGEVGMTGFEPATSASRTQRSARLSYIPRSAGDSSNDGLAVNECSGIDGVSGMPGRWQGQAPGESAAGGSAGEPVPIGVVDRSLCQAGCPRLPTWQGPGLSR